jgi:hypothetical protein
LIRRPSAAVSWSRPGPSRPAVSLIQDALRIVHGKLVAPPGVRFPCLPDTHGKLVAPLPCRQPVDNPADAPSYPRSLGRAPYGNLVAGGTVFRGFGHGNLVAQTYSNNTYILLPIVTRPQFVDKPRRHGHRPGRIRHARGGEERLYPTSATGHAATKERPGKQEEGRGATPVAEPPPSSLPATI